MPADPSFSAPPPRVIGRVQGDASRSTLVCIAGLHGNEPAGVLALRRLFNRLEQDKAGLRGSLACLSGNRRALAAGRRFLARDLNRLWTPEQLSRLRSPGWKEPAGDAEDAEQRELDVELQGFLQAPAKAQVFFLDLHTTSAPGPAYLFLGNTLANLSFARAIPVPIVLGLDDELPGTLLDHLSGQGVVTLGFETGQNEDPRAVDRAEAGAWIALEASGVVERGTRREVAAGRRLLSAESRSLPRIVKVTYRHAITPADHFEMLPGFRSFQPIMAGEPLAHDARGVVAAPFAARILMPLYQPQGNDGFFLTLPVPSLWLSFSASIFRLIRYLHRLPGVRRHPRFQDAFIVDPTRDYFLLHKLLPLLGFRRETAEDGGWLLRRRPDGASGSRRVQTRP
jgi:succinylglutamate desuccinylase